MKWQCGVISAFLFSSVALVAEPAPASMGSPRIIPVAAEVSDGGPIAGAPTVWGGSENGGDENGFLTGTHDFPNFIGWISNPIQNIEPRAVTEFWPIFESAWVSPAGRLPSGDIQVYGAGLNVALSDRLSFGLNQGGYADSHFRDRSREGWLDIGGFLQYTLIADCEDQFLLTAGMRWDSPSGSSQIFQGHPPWVLAGYLTAGKELGEFHVLGTTGYQFPAGSGDRTSNLFYTNVHLDRRFFGWLYPLVEFNWSYHTTAVNLDFPNRGFFDLGNFESTGNIVTVAAGFDAVLVQEKLEIGVVYSTPIASQHGFDFDAVTVRTTLRY